MLKVSNLGSSIFAIELNPTLGRKATIFRPYETGAWSRNPFPSDAGGGYVRPRLQYKASPIRRSARPPGLIRLSTMLGWTGRSITTLFAYSQSYFVRSGCPRMAARRTRRNGGCWRRSPMPVKPEIMDGAFSFRASDGTGQNRQGRVEALKLLEAAGYVLRKMGLSSTRRQASPSFDPCAKPRSGTSASDLCGLDRWGSMPVSGRSTPRSMSAAS